MGRRNVRTIPPTDSLRWGCIFVGLTGVIVVVRVMDYGDGVSGIYDDSKTGVLPVIFLFLPFFDLEEAIELSPRGGRSRA